MADFWANLAKKKKVSEDEAKKTYMEENAKVSDVGVKSSSATIRFAP